jgi:nucleoside-diphosphate-sugar epimerase
MMKIHILGSDGFIGSNIFSLFKAEGKYDVVGYTPNECDLLSLRSAENALSKLEKDDVVVMISGITRLIDNSYDSMQKNIQMAENLCRVIGQKRVGRVVFFSTVDVYGLLDPGVRISEKLLPDPDDHYAISKITSEYILQRCCSHNYIPIAVLRLSGIYGPNDNGKSTINKLVVSAMSGKVMLHGDGSNKRDFVHVRDIYNIIKRIIQTDRDITLNVATGKSYSIKEIVKMLGSLCPEKFTVEHKEEKPAGPKRIVDMVYDISLLNKMFPGFKYIGLKEGLSMYLSDYLKIKGGQGNG